MNGSSIQPRVQFRLSTLLIGIALVATLAAWWLDHQQLALRVQTLEREQRNRAVQRYDLAASRIAAFAERHGGTASRDSVRWMLVNLEGQPVGNAELATIVEEIKVLDRWHLPVPRFLGLFGTQVTEDFARQLGREAPHWRIVITQPLREVEVPAISR